MSDNKDVGLPEDGFELPRLALPEVKLRIEVDDSGLKVFDPLRKKFVALTPEEYVRQHFVDWLNKTKGYPQSLIVNELAIKVNGRRRRCDTVAFSPEGEPLLVVEYKAPSVNVSQTVFDQIVRYNMALRARYLAVSNGMCHYCCRIDYHQSTYNFIPEIPDYTQLRSIHSEN